jgi:CHAT domain-containing protein
VQLALAFGANLGWGQEEADAIEAMLKVIGMAQFSHPAYWAPYALVEDGGR